MSNLIHALIIAVLLAAISFGTAVLQERRYQKEMFKDRDTGCLYVGTPAGGYVVMRNPNGLPQCGDE